MCLYCAVMSVCVLVLCGDVCVCARIVRRYLCVCPYCAVMYIINIISDHFIVLRMMSFHLNISVNLYKLPLEHYAS